MGEPRDFESFRSAASEAYRQGNLESACIDLCRALFCRRDQIDALQFLCRLLIENPLLFVSRPRQEAPPALGKVSVVTCSIDDGKFERVRASWARGFGDAPWELIGIHDAASLAEGLWRGFSRAAGDIIVFAHDDIDILSSDLPTALTRAFSEVDVLGVVGTAKLGGPAHAWSGTIFTRGRIVHPPKPDGSLTLDLFNLATGVTKGMQAIDGVFMAARRSVVEAIGFDAATFDGFHLYDIDFSYRAFLAGARVGVSSEVVLLHDSDGAFDASWMRYAGRFQEKFPTVTGQRAQNVIVGIPFADRAALLAFSARLDEVGRRALAG